MELKFEILNYLDSMGRLSPLKYSFLPDDIKQICTDNNITIQEYVHMVKNGYSSYILGKETVLLYGVQRNCLSS